MVAQELSQEFTCSVLRLSPERFGVERVDGWKVLGSLYPSYHCVGFFVELGTVDRN